ncbi:hypothetical protein P5G65_16585 [Paenibacillus chondroitinus]|uniref:Uncharacterized protein n=1 Tax=Paenibacillus chondroitinus TaxID=59842 RepID=A0ABU6DCW9_9BACL|nr:MULTISPECIES: hypothetical protein [Paenibacillus]MCY9659863.1 hypothetical protein [Paenibacillus anseongense]MEB4795519.1 hypothetical protein [Paenibacillus chondroitinus]
MDRPLISEHEMIKETEIFYKIYSVFIDEIEQIESVRGKLNDFQLMQAVSRAKDTMGILGWERRQTVNSIFEKYMHIYRVFGRAKAHEWVKGTFGYNFKMRNDTESEASPELPKPENSLSEDEETSINHKNVEPRIQELSRLIVEKEAELLQLYREFYLLQ